jgi:hypothetical protein
MDREPEVSQSYAVALESEFAQGNATGTLVFYAGNDRYEATFGNVVASVRGDSINSGTPVVVHLPSAVHVDGAYVGSVETPMAGYCSAGNVWLPQEVGQSGAILHFDRARFLKTAAHLPPIDAVLAERESSPSCDHPNVAAHVDSETTDTAALAQELQKSAAPPSVAIAVALTPSGAIAATKVILSKAGHALEEHTLHEALHASYVPEHFRCAPVSSTYLFTSSGF